MKNKIINWLKKILGISHLEKIVIRHHKAIGRIERIEKKIRLDRKPQRYDEIERVRSRRKKAGRG